MVSDKDWEKLDSEMCTVSETLAKEFECSELLLTLADLSSELAQYSMRKAFPGESLYKDASVMDLFKYMTKVSIFERAVKHKMKDYEDLCYSVKTGVINDMKEHYMEEAPAKR